MCRAIHNRERMYQYHLIDTQENHNHWICIGKCGDDQYTDDGLGMIPNMNGCFDARLYTLLYYPSKLFSILELSLFVYLYRVHFI